MICNICPRRCGAIRVGASNTGGYCKAGETLRVARAGLHRFEEPFISGERGSGTVFFSRCSLGCVFCQNGEISHGGFGKDITVNRLADIFRELVAAGAHNINLVTPTHYSYAIKKALDIYRPQVPIVYNTSGYELPEVIKSLSGYVDVFLFDYKYFNADSALKYSNAPDYPEFAKSALLAAYISKGECVFGSDGIIKSGVVVRHLLLPGATAEAISVFDFVKENTPGAYFSIMNQYVPLGAALDMPVISRKVTEREYEKVLAHIIDSGFKNCCYQERGSADTRYIPNFDLSGV